MSRIETHLVKIHEGQTREKEAGPRPNACQLLAMSKPQPTPSGSDKGEKKKRSGSRELIRRQVEFYLSEGNLSRDRLFRSEMERRPDQGIPIELLLKCNRLQRLGVNEEKLARAVAKSSLLQLSADGKAVVRTKPLITLSPREKRTVLVVGIPRWSSERGPNEDVEGAETTNDQLPSSSTNTASANPGNPDWPTQVYEETWRITEWLRDLFGEFGQVLYVTLPQYHSSGLLRGFAFVEFAEAKEAQAAAKSMRPTNEGEVWHVNPDMSAPSGTKNCPENAWKPRLAAKASFFIDDMLSRRYTWRCCSRKNKQIQTAFRQLRVAGYRAPNPCDREYELITLGESSPEARLKHSAESYGQLDRARLRVFRYDVWNFWKDKFYLWLNAWIARMRRKTEELSINSADLQPVTDKPPNKDDGNTPEGDVHMKESKNAPDEEMTQKLVLPRDFVPNTIVQIFWPVCLVPEVESGDPCDATDSEFITKRPLSLARRLRISLEQHLLSPAKLLNEVAHLDTIPNEQVLARVSEICSDNVVTVTDTNGKQIDHYPLFIRLKSTAAACQLIDFLGKLKSKPPREQQWFSDVRAHLLEGKTELAYCAAITSSLMGATERRRRAQVRRRRKSKHDVVVEPPSHQVAKCKQNFVGNMSSDKPRHIIFDE
ncbi:unnamed protein product [Calicophoron daubneyi]|uniref:La-related protein 7 n=1 Tax=Calicophoron daubneyi TaxID=300641 RepID=A0AAV2T6A3_CALDB